MLKKIMVAFAAVVLLSGCSCSKYRSDRTLTAELEKTAGSRVLFDLNSSNLTSETKATLANQAKWFSERKTLKVVIEGHCDERGTREYNMALGERRANTVKQFLVKNGVSMDRIETVSYGKEKPEVMGNDQASYAKNRRAVTTIK
ncbi:MAG: peptidoglycan-associated lipoprotein Pal [Rickettsiaceae bacterium]|nr:peptidoglycan-associated lipoprotein Pal [Rickettsiaceae bacterium]